MAELRHGLDDPQPWTRNRTIAVVIVGSLVPVSVILAVSFADIAWPIVPSFSTVHAYVSGVLALVTAVVLIGYAIASRRWGYYALGGAYATMVVTTFAFPLFYPNGLVVADPPEILLGGPQSAVFLFIYKNVVFPLFMMVGALVLFQRRGQSRNESTAVPGIIWVGAGVVIGLAGVIIAGPGSDLLPTLVESNVATQAAHFGFIAVALACLAAVIVSGLTMRSGSSISLWVFIVLVVEFSGALVTLEADARYTANWYLNRFFGTIALAILLMALIRQVARLDRSLSRATGSDPLTGAANRLGVLTELERRSQPMLAHQGPTVLLWLDLDTFRSVNEQWGYPVGDEVLRVVMSRVEEVAGNRSIVGRLGADEIGVVVSGPDCRERSEEIARQALDAIRAPILVLGRTVSVSGSVGLAVMDAGMSVDDVVIHADMAMQAAKATGGDRLRWFDASMSAVPPRVTVAQTRQDFMAAIEAGEVGPVYQPIVDSVSGRVVGVEALARWRRVNREITPGEFFGEIERAGLLPQLGRRMIKQVGEDSAEIWRMYPDALTFVNFTSWELADELLVEELLASPLGRNPRQLVIEITEQIEFEVAGSGLRGLDRLISAGIRVAIDDFGSGYSSLERIAAITPALVKIDRFLVQQTVVEPKRGRQVFSAATALGRSLDCVVIAEGVETEAERAAVVELGANWIQGYLIARPAPLAALARV